ncbi:MAG TPA: hypothetical protein VN238_03000 [Solirubrobacteraceae bacterium]|nr:hypothetical protein [Solirubrobacteraceae bacterium]
MIRRTVLLGLALAGVAAPAPTPARAAAQLEIVPSDGSPRTVLARSGGDVDLEQPVWAHDGASVTYLRNDPSSPAPAELLRVPASGARSPAIRVRRVGGASDGRLSPDGRLFAEPWYRDPRTGRTVPLVVRDVATGVVRARLRPTGPPSSIVAIVNGREEGPCWSRDGRHLAVTETTRGGDGHLTRVLDTATGRTVLQRVDDLYTPGDGECFTPSGELTLSAGVDVPDAARVVDLRTHALRRVPALGRKVHGPLAWSPDGTRLAYGSEDGVAVVDAATGRGPRLPIVADGPRNQDAAYALRFLAWSPDGRTLAYVYDPSDELSGDEPATRGPSLLVMPADASAPPRELVRASTRSTITGIAWSPDGTRLALASARP